MPIRAPRLTLRSSVANGDDDIGARLRPTLFDDYPNNDLGHHPAFALGLARAAHARFGEPTPLYCPRSYLAGAGATAYLRFLECEGPRPYTPTASSENVTRVARETELDGDARFVFNLFLDENFGSFDRVACKISFVHALHRPGPGPRGPESSRPALQWLAQRPRDLLVVHTNSGLRRAAEIAPAARIARIGWPAAHRDEVIRRFAKPSTPTTEPQVLLIGGARLDKGIRTLLDAIEGGPELRVVGEQAPGMREQLEADFPRARVRWDVGWAPTAALDEAIDAASACVFPYLPEFGRHGGASAALAHALTHPTPVIISTVLADQIPASDACLVVPAGEVAPLERAIERAVSSAAELRAAAGGHLAYALAEHTYEGHLKRVLERLTDLQARQP